MDRNSSGDDVRYKSYDKNPIKIDTANFNINALDELCSPTSAAALVTQAPSNDAG